MNNKRCCYAHIAFLAAKPDPAYISAGLINVLNSNSVISAEPGVQLFGVGRQYGLAVGYRF